MYNRGQMNSPTIYVNQIPASYDVNDINELFSTYGKITAVTYPVDKKTNLAKGYAFVTFDNAESAQQSLEKNNTEIEENILIVEIAKEKVGLDKNSANTNKKKNKKRKPVQRNHAEKHEKNRREKNNAKANIENNEKNENDK